MKLVLLPGGAPKSFERQIRRRLLGILEKQGLRNSEKSLLQSHMCAYKQTQTETWASEIILSSLHTSLETCFIVKNIWFVYLICSKTVIFN